MKRVGGRVKDAQAAVPGMIKRSDESAAHWFSEYWRCDLIQVRLVAAIAVREHPPPLPPTYPPPTFPAHVNTKGQNRQSPRVRERA